MVESGYTPTHEGDIAMSAEEIRLKLKTLASPAAAKLAQRFFKTGPGEYGEGEKFLGIKVPVLRALSREHRSIPLDEIAELLNSTLHEERHLALMILVLQVAKADDTRRKEAFELYLANTRFINNWDLVDCSAPGVVGGYLFSRSKKTLLALARSTNLWERRIAIVSTQHFIRQGEFAETLKISQMLLRDSEDLIHKATGWMLREVGDRDPAVLEEFLDRHAATMPRTMLRYAIEKFPAPRRLAYLQMGKPTKQ